MYFVLSFILKIALFLQKFTPLAKILHCRRQWRQWQISPLIGAIFSSWHDITPSLLVTVHWFYPPHIVLKKTLSNHDLWYGFRTELSVQVFWRSHPFWLVIITLLHCPPTNVCSLNPCKKSVQWQHCRCLSLLRNLVAGGYVRRDRPGSTSCDNVSLSAFYLTYCQQQKWRTRQVIQIFFWATFMKDRQGGTIYHVKPQRFPFFATTFLLSLT